VLGGSDEGGKLLKPSRLIQLLVLAALFFACDQGDGYPPEVVRNFMNACTTEAGGTEEAEDACTCVIERLQEEMTLDEFLEFEDQIEAGEGIPSEVGDIIDRCASGVA
jgi:hypothetical protein